MVRRLFQGVGAAHAVLFYGVEGCGKGRLAHLLCKAWLCNQPGDEGACGLCAVCRAYDSGRAVDFQRISPQGASGLIRRGNIRETTGSKAEENTVPLIDFFRTGPLMARHKVVWVESADRMNSDAANALLKTLEEPSAYAKVVLTTSEFARVLPTIRSRCMAVACELPSADEVAQHAGELTSFDEGSPGRLEAVRRHAEAYQRLESILESVSELPWGAALMVSEAIREVAERLADSEEFNARSANAEVLRATALWLVKHRTTEPHLARLAAEAHRAILGNANPGATFDHLCIQLLGPDAL